MAVTPQFAEIVPTSGFDSTEPGLIVPQFGDNYAALRAPAALSASSLTRGVSVEEIVNPVTLSTVYFPILAAHPLQGMRLIRVHGDLPGLTRVDVGNGTRTDVSLHVAVLPQKGVRVAFYFVKDTAAQGRGGPGGPGISTKWKPADADRWVKELNALYTPQANIAVVIDRAEVAPIPWGRGDRVTLRGYDFDLASRLKPFGAYAQQRPNAHFNVFLVRELKTALDDDWGIDTETVRDEAPGRPPHICLVEDQTNLDRSLILAYEIGRHLGLRENKVEGTVMFEEKSRRGPKILFREAIGANDKAHTL